MNMNQRTAAALLLATMAICLLLLCTGCKSPDNGQESSELSVQAKSKFAKESLPDVTLMMHDANQEIPSLIASGEADIMITEVVEAGYYAGQDERLAAPLIHEPFTDGELGVLMPKGSEDLLDYVNRFLAEEKESGRIDQLAGEYFYRA